jgi:hypothetical protein
MMCLITTTSKYAMVVEVPECVLKTSISNVPSKTRIHFAFLLCTNKHGLNTCVLCECTTLPLTTIVSHLYYRYLLAMLQTCIFHVPFLLSIRSNDFCNFNLWNVMILARLSASGLIFYPNYYSLTALTNDVIDFKILIIWWNNFDTLIYMS